MNILFFSEYFPPETTSISRLYSELACDLADLGHSITVITETPRYNVAPNSDQFSCRGSFKLLRFPAPKLPRSGILLRLIEQLIKSIFYMFAVLFSSKADAVLVSSPPLVTAFFICLCSRIRRFPVAVFVQDLYPQVAIDLGYLKNKISTGISRALEHYVYRSSALLIVHSQGHVKWLTDTGIAEDKINIVPNWVDTKEIKPFCGDVGRLKREFGLSPETFVVSFAGVIGPAQEIENIIHCAELFKDRPDVKFVIAGDGIKSSYIKHTAASKNLSNIVFLPLLDHSSYVRLLYCSDICLISLSRLLTTPTVPGKLAMLLAAGKPVIASTPITSDAKNIIEVNGCGVWVPAGDATAFKEAVVSLLNDKEKRLSCGLNSRRFAETNYSRKKCTCAVDSAICSLISK